MRDVQALAQHGVQHAREFVLAGIGRRTFERRPQRAIGRGCKRTGAGFLERLARLLLGQHGEARRDVRLQAITAQNALAEAMNGHDGKAARRVDDGREQAAGQRDLARFGRARQRLGEQRAEVRIARRGPLAELGEHARFHLGGGVLGERQAQDRARLGAREQEPQDTLHQHVGLAGAGVRADPGRDGRIGGAALLLLSGGKQLRLRHRR